MGTNYKELLEELNETPFIRGADLQDGVNLLVGVSGLHTRSKDWNDGEGPKTEYIIPCLEVKEDGALKRRLLTRTKAGIRRLLPGIDPYINEDGMPGHVLFIRQRGSGKNIENPIAKRASVEELGGDVLDELAAWCEEAKAETAKHANG